MNSEWKIQPGPENHCIFTCIITAGVSLSVQTTWTTCLSPHLYKKREKTPPPFPSKLKLSLIADSLWVWSGLDISPCPPPPTDRAFQQAQDFKQTPGAIGGLQSATLQQTAPTPHTSAERIPVSLRGAACAHVHANGNRQRLVRQSESQNMEHGCFTK